MGVRAGALAAVEVRAGAAGGNEDQIALGVGGEDRPGVGGAGRERGRHRVPAPAQPAGAGVEGAHDALGRIHPLIVAHRRPDDHEAGCHGRRGRDPVLPVVTRRVTQPGRQVHRALRAEVGARPAGAAVERDEPGIDGGEEDPAPAGQGPRPCRIEPGRHTAVGEVAVVALERDARIVAPPLGASRRVERDHSAQRRRDVERAVHHQRGGLKAAPVAQVVAGAVHPGDPELRDVARCDPGER